MLRSRPDRFFDRLTVSLVQTKIALFLFNLLLSLWCFSIFVKYYFQVSVNLK